MDIPCTGRNNMVAIGSTVKDRALTLRVRFGAYPESARRRPEKVGFPHELERFPLRHIQMGILRG